MTQFFFNAKKSQSELLGFAIVVLLIAVGMLFVIGFIVLDKQTNTRATYLYKQTATNLNDALLETTTTCRSLTVRELYLSCVDDNRAICPLVDSTFNPDTVTACDYLHGFLQNRLTETLDVWGYDYKYSYRLGKVRESSDWFVQSPRNVASCAKQRSSLVLSGDTNQVIIYLDIFDCAK